MIYLTCPRCGYIIDKLTEQEANDPVRSRRLKYLTTRDQICPNCVSTIARCERIDAREDEIPIMRIEVNSEKLDAFKKFCREKGYAVATEYAYREFSR